MTCTQCGNVIESGDVHAGYGMCGPCLHDAMRSGWIPDPVECGMCHALRPAAEWCLDSALEDADTGAYAVCAECSGS